MSAVAGIGNTMTQLGSDAATGVVAWTATMLQDATRDYPAIPLVDVPTTDPGSASPPPDPDGPPGWYLPLVLLAILAMEALNQTLSPVPARDPLIGSGADPANGPLSTPAPTAMPTEDPSCAADVNYLRERAEHIHNGLHQWGIDNLTTAVLRVKMKDGSCLDYVGGSAYKITDNQQRRMIRGREVLARRIYQHAEETVIHSAQYDFFTERLIAMGVSREICDWWNCRTLINQTGGSIHASQQGATWP